MTADEVLRLTFSQCFCIIAIFAVFSLSAYTAGQMDFSQVSGPLMTPPISPAALVHRGSVINQGPMTGRPLPSSSSSTACSSSSSCPSSLSAVTQPNPCSSYPETLYHCLPQTSSSYFPPGSGSASHYQPAHRSASFSPSAVCRLPVVFLMDPVV